MFEKGPEGVKSQRSLCEAKAQQLSSADRIYKLEPVFMTFHRTSKSDSSYPFRLYREFSEVPYLDSGPKYFTEKFKCFKKIAISMKFFELIN